MYKDVAKEEKGYHSSLRVLSRSFGQWAAANCAALPTVKVLMLVSTPLRTVNRCYCGFLVSGGI